MEQEVVKSEVDNTQIENKTTTTNEAQATTEQDTPEQINWRKFREAREVERKQKIEAEKRAAEKEAEAQALRAALEAVVNKPTPNQYQDSNAYTEETDEDRINRLVKQNIDAERKRMEEERSVREQAEMPQKLASTYQDFNQVCSENNIDYLEYHYPEIYTAFKNLPDSYDKWSNIYKTVKKLVPNQDSRKDQARAEKNFQKPQAMSIAGKTQVGDSAPMNLDEKRKMDNWQRMQKVIRGGG